VPFWRFTIATTDEVALTTIQGLQSYPAICHHWVADFLGTNKNCHRSCKQFENMVTIPILESSREFDDFAVAVILAKAGIQESWMPDQVGHDNARASADPSQFQPPHGERLGSLGTVLNCCFIPTEL
jgi:hypothetical protein